MTDDDDLFPEDEIDPNATKKTVESVAKSRKIKGVKSALDS
jgi:hypothetical protein